MKKRIAFVHNAVWEMYNFRGDLLKELSNKGYDVTVICPPDEKNEHFITEELGLKLITVPMNRKGTNFKEEFKFTKNLHKIYKEEKFDLIFHYTIKPNIFGTIAAKLAGVKSIAITTGLGYAFMHNNLTSYIARFLYKFSLTFAQEVWFLNDDDMKIFLENDLVTEGQAFKLPSEGINLKRFSPQVKEKNDKTTFLMIARVLYDKGFKEFVEAAKIIKETHKDIEFQLLGALDKGNPTGVPEEEVLKAVNEEIINYLGTTKDVVPVIAKADCLVLPSYREGVSRVLMEAAAMGKPIIATNVTGCREVVDNGKTGFLCKLKNSKDLSEKMEKLISLTHEERVLMGQKGREKVAEEMELEKIIDIYDYKILKITGEKQGLTLDLEEFLSIRKKQRV